MRLENPWVLLLILLIPIFHRVWMNRNRSARVSYSLPIPKAIGSSSPTRILLGLKYLSLVLLIAALARPQNSFKQTERTVSGVDIMLCLDVSASMDIEDLGDRSRIDIAKDMMQQFVKGRQNDRIGFVMFAGEPLTLAPPTLDYGLVLKAIQDARIGLLRDGTAIGDGLAVAVSHLRDSKAKSKVIVLLTDGDNNLGQVDPATAGELAAGYGIRVYTIAIGKEGRVKLPIHHTGIMGQTVTSYQWFDNALNPELLQIIAKTSNGKFYRVSDEDTLGSVFKEIDQLEKSDVKSKEKIHYDEIYQKPLKLGVFLLFIEQILERALWVVIP